MQNYNYDQIENIQEDLNHKLLNYIELYFDNDSSLDAIEFYYPDFDDQKSNEAFNNWISIDFKTKYGKSFIEHLLEEKTNLLDPIEREILTNRLSSFISLYRIEEIKNENIYVTDLLNNKEEVLWDPKSVNILKEDDLVFGRITNVLGSKSFYGVISFLPNSMKNNFLNKVIVDYNYKRLENYELTMDSYLRSFSLNLYKIYTELVNELIEIDEILTSELYDELEDFEDYMRNYLSNDTIREYIDNLIGFYEYYLTDEDMSLKDINKIDLNEILILAIENGLINTKEDFISYVDTFKHYLKYLKCINKKYRPKYFEIMKIWQNPFIYFELINKMDTPFSVNKTVSEKIYKKITEKAFNIIMDYDRFILHVIDHPLNLSEENHIKYRDLVKLNSIMDNSIENTKHHVIFQKNYPLIDFFYFFSIRKNIMSFKKGFLVITERGNQFLRLKDQDKFSLMLSFLLSDEFMEDVLNIYNKNYLISKIQYSICENNSNYIFDENSISIYDYFNYLKAMGIIEIFENQNIVFHFSSFGRYILNLFLDIKPYSSQGKVISIKDFRKTN